MTPGIFESNRAEVPRTPSEVPAHARELLSEGDEAVRDQFHRVSSQPEDFTDSTRDILQGLKVNEIDNLSPKAKEILQAQESQYAQLQTDIAGIQSQLDDSDLSSDERNKLNQRLVERQRRADQIGKFLQEARGYVGPSH
ncbi:MAG: hypothetical protein E6R05_06295 [Candidatus Moraniibacteriota bacterium]|nr:MAG: hypothetical protein E6R05_06295 [Candidatus Moranbacteria bacterium]